MRDLLNCPNCGAAITGCKCEFCGTQFFDLADIELNKAGYLRVRVNDRILMFKCVPTALTINQSVNEVPNLTAEFLLFGMDEQRRTENET